MTNLFIRLSASFACITVKLVEKRKKEIGLAHIVKKVHLKKAKICFVLKYKQTTKIVEALKTKKDEVFSSSFRSKSCDTTPSNLGQL